RGPFTETTDRKLMAAHSIDIVVAKNSGGTATYGKIAAARALGLPIILLRRPALPEVPTVGTIEEAMTWLNHAVALRGGETGGAWPGRHTSRVCAVPTIIRLAMSAAEGSAVRKVMTAIFSSALPTARPNTTGVVAGR